MAENVETEFAVIKTYAAVPDTAEGHIGVRYMHNGIVDAAAA